MPEPTDFEPCLLVLSLACVIAPKLLSFKSNKYYLAFLPSSDVCMPVSCFFSDKYLFFSSFR